MFERFTDRARRVLVLAQEEARLLNHNFIGTEHILLGLVAEEESVAAQALGALDITLEAVRERVAKTIGTGKSAPGGSPPFTPRAKKILELSLREALQLNHNYIGTEHMLLGLVREGEGVASQVLIALGAPLDRVRDEVMRLVSSGASEPTRAWQSGVEPTRRVQGGVELTVSRSRRSRLPGSAGVPECPGCRMDLTDTLRWRHQSVPGASPSDSPRHATVWWCRECGRTLSVTPAPDEQGEHGSELAEPGGESPEGVSHHEVSRTMATESGTLLPPEPGDDRPLAEAVRDVLRGALGDQPPEAEPGAEPGEEATEP